MFGVVSIKLYVSIQMLGTEELIAYVNRLHSLVIVQ